MSAILFSPREVAMHIAKRARERRLSLNLSQRSLSDRSGVSLGVIKQFEQVGKISFESLLKIALVLENLNEFMELFKWMPENQLPSLDVLIKQKKRKRGRK